MTTLNLTLAADTDTDELLNVTHPELGSSYSSIILDMLHSRDYGPHAIEIDTGNSSDDGNPNADYLVMYFADEHRAAISDNGSVHWTDARDMADAHRRYLNDELVA